MNQDKRLARNEVIRQRNRRRFLTTVVMDGCRPERRLCVHCNGELTSADNEAGYCTQCSQPLQPLD